VALGIGRKELRATGGSDGQSYRSSTINLALFRSTLDRYPNPGRGYQLDLESETGTLAGPQLHPDAALGRARLRGLLVGSPGRLGRLNLVWAQEVLASGTAGYRYTPQAADLGRFGGSASLRGYREDQFAAVWGVVSRTELRYRFGPTSRLHLFVDAARLAGLDPLMAAGAGLVVAAGGNLIQVDFAWTRHDRWQEGKVHLRLTNPLGQGVARP
jgi:outer membrane protein assembly factor BamA